MRLLFVGEGPHDIGRSALSPAEPAPAGGVVPALSRRVVPAIAAESRALRWADIPRFAPSARRGFAGKVAAAVLLSQRRFGLDGTVCVADRDRDAGRLHELQTGRERGLSLLTAPHAVVCAVAVESIEAWTLGAGSALSQTLSIPRAELARRLPSDLESLSEGSGKPERRPKGLLAALCEGAQVQDCADLRARIAEATDIPELARACSQGFAPFVRALKDAFASLEPSERPSVP